MSKRAKTISVAGLLTALYFATRLYHLTLLPVFADEAIYIRWAQMIVHDPRQYTFLPLYDGKTPLYIWGLIPWLNISPLDPLWVSRLFAALAGFVTLLTLTLIVRELKGGGRAQLWAGILAIILPFPLFYSRMGLIDALLTLFLAASFGCLLRWRNQHYRPLWVWLAGIFWGLALLTKTSALYYILVPWSIFLLDMRQQPPVRQKQVVIPFLLAGIIGLSMLLSLRVSPLFPFLFQRSSDFAFTVQEILTEPMHILTLNSYRISKWLTVYLTPGLLLILGGFFLLRDKDNRTKQLIQDVRLLIISALVFLLPFLLSGKLLSSRYFLPVIIWAIPAAALILEQFFKHQRWLFYGLAATVLFFSGRFAFPLLTEPGKTPFANEDVVQYLTEWSAGYGIPEVRDFLRQEAVNHKVVVATEGYFGTLPDGLFMYFDRSALLNNLEIYGIGLPLKDIKPDLLAKAEQREAFILVNENRMELTNSDLIQLVARYPRPLNGPALLLFKIKPASNP